MIRTRCLLMLTPLPFALACGPAIVPLQDETSSSSEGSDGLTASTSTSTSTSTTTASTNDTTGDTTDDTTGSVFLIAPDGGTCVVSDDGYWHCTRCDLWQQDCPAGEKCTAWASDGGSEWNATRCSPIARDPGGPGDPCTMMGSPTSGLDDCDLGSMCWGVDPTTLEGTCVSHCQGPEADPICDPATSCVIANDGALVLCLPLCDPLAPDACPAGEACLTTDRDDDPVCISAGIEVQPCGEVACSMGEACLDDALIEACMGFGCCTPWCDLNAADPDAACAAVPAHACLPYHEAGTAPMGLEHLGVCRLPA
ncbi:ribulose phosphate epimerase [Paraliomyxa miuraensis]|uniref:ribulose phosphate epimerase n=1 Tax=Paraliomyxa miuraensis TaxID=376150 RepID=UPI002257FAF6|nr:ribulose phosphate epimerase [Paraliomyxa miuraensis]MCX4247552.1 ribulose phosphate epimerase [Paraliomyxa miuraensis]